MDSHEPKVDRFARVPDALRQRLIGDVPLEQVIAVAPFDLSEEGHYISGYLALREGQLGSFLKSDGHWEGHWIPIPEKSEAIMFEGLGMGTLRLIDETSMLGEWRFTRRHEKEVAELHRQLEKQLKVAEAEAFDRKGPKPDEKKTKCDKCGKAIPDWSEVCPSCLSRRKVLSRLMDFVKPYKYRAMVGFGLSIFLTLLGLLPPFLTKFMVNDGLGAARGGHGDYRLLLKLVGLWAGVMVLSAVLGGVRQRLMAALGSRMARDIRDTTYTHLHKLSLSFYAKKPTGSLITRITSDSDRIWDFIAWTLLEAVNSFVLIGGVAGFLFLLNWRLALIVLIPVPLMLAVTIFFHNRMHFYFHRIFHRWSQMTSVVSDAIPGVRVIKAFAQERREVDRFSSKNDHVYRGEMDMITLWTLFGPVLDLSTQVGAIVVWILGGYWVIDGRYAMDVGTLIAFTGLMWRFYDPIHNIAHMDRQFNRAATSVQRIFDVLDTPPAVFSKAGAVKTDGFRGDIELRNATFSYDGVRRVLRNVSVKINAGEMIGLAGPSGGGKTTLINLICRFYDVLEGQILIDGIDVRDYDMHDLRRQIGVVLQEPFLFYGTVADNIAYGNPDATREDVIRAARAANAHDFVVGFPDGYDSMVGERGQTLSGGERQRISIARAILHNPKILVLDEATSSVDTESEKLIQDAIMRLVNNRTTIAIAHRLSTLQRADRLIVLDKGEMVEQGSHAELAKKEGGIYAKLLGMQMEMQSFIAVGG